MHAGAGSLGLLTFQIQIHTQTRHHFAHAHALAAVGAGRRVSCGDCTCERSDYAARSLTLVHCNNMLVDVYVCVR